jgi:hypothetical protein
MTPPTPPTPPLSTTAHLDADLLGLAGALDALGAAERAGPDAGLEGRLLGAVMTEVRSVAPVARKLDDLAARERAGAKEGLEARVHEASRRDLASRPALRLAGEGRVTVVRRAWHSGVHFRAAAAMLLVAGAGVMVRLATVPTRVLPASGEVAAARLDTEIGAELSQLFSVMEEQGTAKASTDVSTDELAEWLSQGASS